MVQEGCIVEKVVRLGDRLLAAAALDNLATWTFDNEVNASFETTYSSELELRKSGAGRNPRVEMQLPARVRIVVPVRAR